MRKKPWKLRKTSKRTKITSASITRGDDDGETTQGKFLELEVRAGEVPITEIFVHVHLRHAIAEAGYLRGCISESVSHAQHLLDGCGEKLTIGGVGHLQSPLQNVIDFDGRIGINGPEDSSGT